MPVVAKRMSALGTENAFRLGDDIRRCVERGEDPIRFNLGEPDFDSIPEINAVAIAQIAAGNSHYCDPAGLLPFRETLARHVSQSRGIDVDPAQVVVTPGGKPTIGYTFQTYVDPGDEVIYPSPGFPIYESWATFVGAKPVPIPLSESSGFAFTPEELDALLTPRTKLVILNSPSNPTGGVLSESDLAGIADVIERAVENGRCHPNLRVYSDEIYEHILFDGEEHHSLASFGRMAERTIIATGFSKSFAMTGWRLGYSVLPNETEAALFKQLNINLVSCVPPFIQMAGNEAFLNPAAASGVQRMVSEFQARRDWIVPALNEIDGVRCAMPKGAFYVFPNVRGVCERLGVLDAYAGLQAEARARTSPSRMLQMFLLYRHGVATLDRKSFGGIGADDEHFLRVSIASSLDELKTGVARIAAAADDRDGMESFLRLERTWK